MADEIASIYIDANLDLRKIDQQLANLQNKKYLIKVETDQSDLVSLNTHLDLKRRDLDKTISHYKNNPLVVYTNQTQLTNLNRQLKEFKDVKVAFHFDDREILKGLNNITKEFQATKLKLSLDIGYLSNQIQKSFDQTIKSSSFQTNLILKDNRNNTQIINALKSVENAVNKSNSKSILGTIGTGIFEGLGDQIFKSLAIGLKKDLGVNVNQIARPITKFIAKPLSKVNPESIKKLEDDLVSSLEQYFIFKNPEAAQEKLKNAVKPAIEEIGETLLDAVSGGLFLLAQPLRIRKRVLLAQSAKQAQELAESIIIPDQETKAIEKSKSISLITGGIDYQKGGLNTFFAENLIKRILPGSYSKPVTNPYSNDINNLGFLYKLKNNLSPSKPTPLDILLQTNIEKGFNPDSVKLASEAIAYRKKFPDKPIQLAGSSGGSFVVEEAIGILERAGISNIKGIGITAPVNNLLPVASTKNYQTNVGEFDPLNIAMFGNKYVTNKDHPIYQKTIEGLGDLPLLTGLLKKSPHTNIISGAGKGHELLAFLTNPEFQSNIQQFLGSNIDPINKSLTGLRGQPGLHFYKSQQDEKQVISRTIAAILGDSKTLKQIQKNNFEGAEGYTFAVPQKPEYRRDNDFISMIGNLPKEKSIGEDLKTEYKEYVTFLNTILEGIKEFLDSGGKVKTKISRSLNEAIKFYPELKSVQSNLLKVSEEHSRLLVVNKTPINLDSRTAKEKYKDLSRQQRIESQYPQGIDLSPKIIPVQKVESIFQKQNPGLGQNYIDSSVSQAKKLAEIFRNNFTGDKQLTGVKTLIDQGLKSGDLSKATEYAQNIRKAAIAAKQEITNLRKSLGSEELTAKTSAGKGAYESINAYIGQVSKVDKKILDQFKKIGIALPDIADDVIQGFVVEFKNNQEIEKAIEEKFENVIDVAKDVLDIQSPSKVFQVIGEQVVKGFEQGLASIQSFDLESFFENFAHNIQNLFLNFTKLGAGFFVFSQVLPKLKEFAEQSIKISTNFETIERNIKFLSGANGLSNINAIKDQSLALGLNVQQSLQGASQLYGATVGTNLEGSQTTEIFKNFQTLFASRSIDAEKQQRANLAISQSASKGIQSEEIRQQLAEAVPGAFQILARSQGLSAQQLDRRLRRGALPAEELVKFSQQASNESLIGLPSALNTTQASINRLDNSVLLLQKNVGDTFLPLEKLKLDALTNLTNLLSKNADLIKSTFGYFTLWATSPLWKYIAAAIYGIKLDFVLLTANIKSLTFAGAIQGLQAFGIATLNVLKPFTLFAAKFLVFQAAVSAIGQLINRFRDLSGEIGDIAKQSKSSTDELQKLFDVNKKNQTLENSRPKNQKEIEDNELLRRSKPGSFLKSFDSEVLGGIFGSGESYADYLQRINQTKNNIKTIIDSSKITQSVANNDQIGQELKRLDSLDRYIADIQAKKNALLVNDPNNNLGIQDIDRESASLLNTRGDYVKNISSLQSAIALRIDELKKAKEVFDELLKKNPDAVTQQEYLEISKGVSEELKQQELLQDKINKSIGKTQTNFELLQRTIELINSEYADFSQNVELTNIRNKINLTNSLDKNNITPGNFQFLSGVNEVKSNTAKLNESIQNIKRLQTALASQESKRVLDANEINENTGLNRINLQAQRLVDFPNDKFILEQFAAYKQAKINLENEVLVVSQARSTLINSLKENTKQVGEYYLQISRQVEKSKIDFEIQSNNIAKINAQNDIRKTLIGVEDNIFTQFAEGLIQNLEDLADLENTKTNNKNIVLDTQNQLADNAKQAIELSRSLPGDLPSIPVTLDFKDVRNDENVRKLNNELTQTTDLGRLINQSFYDTSFIFGKTNSELERSNNLTSNWQESLNGISQTVANIQKSFASITDSNNGGGVLSNITSLFSNIPKAVSGIVENVTNFFSSSKSGNSSIISPLKGVSIQKLLDYKPSQGQGFFGLRDGGKRQHSKVDFDSRVGGGEGAIAQAVINGIATKRQITGTSAGVDIQGRDVQGRAITVVYNHLRLGDVNGLFGGQKQINVGHGQQLGRITKDALSSGAHLDFGIKINGQYVDPQKFLRTSSNSTVANIQTNSVTSSTNKSGSFQSGLLNLVKNFEGFRANAYPDYGQFSVGYGTRAKNPNEVIGEKEATNRLNNELQGALSNVLANVKPKLKDNQLQALTSLVYNAGSITQFPKLLNAVNSGNLQEASKQFLDINKAKGQVLSGLTARRIKESQLFSGNLALQTSLQGDYLNPGQLQNQLTQGSLSNQNIIQQKKVLDTQLNNAEIERKKIEIERKNDQLLNNFRRGLRDQGDTDLSNRRQIQDLQFNSNSIRTPDQNFQSQLIAKDREFEDRIRERQRRLELVIKEQIEVAQGLLKNPQIVGTVRKELESGLAQSLESKRQIETELVELERLRNESRDVADKVFTFQEIFRKQKLFYGEVQESLSQQSREIENVQRRNPVDLSRGNPLDVAQDQQFIQISLDYITKRNEIFNSSDLDFADKRRENIRNILNSFRNSKISAESFDIQREQQEIQKLQTENERTSSFETFSNQPRIDLLNARANRINSNGGNQFEANALSRQAGVIQENIRYAKELRDVQIQILQFKFQGIDTTGLESIRDSLQQIHEINVEKIGNDFKSFGSTVENIARTSLNSLSQSFADLITKGGSLTDIFDNLFNNVLNSVINIGLNALLGSVFGGLFYDGGIVPNYAMGGVHGISKSMSKERLMSGRKPMLAVVHAGELQIPADRVDQLSMQGLTPDVLLGNFAEGGIVGNPNLNKSYSRNSENRENQSSKIIVESTVINKQEYVTVEQFKEGIKKAAEMGAEGGEQRVHNKLSNSISYRKSLGL